MGNLKKVITLHQASNISGYHQDYLSALIRKNEIKGEKVGGNWFTTEEEIRNYIFKQKIRNKNWVVKFLMYFKKMNKSFLYSLIILALIVTGIYFYNKKFGEVQAEAQNTQPTSNINNLRTTPELKF
jgi:hypothetical protein